MQITSTCLSQGLDQTKIQGIFNFFSAFIFIKAGTSLERPLFFLFVQARASLFVFLSWMNDMINKKPTLAPNVWWWEGALKWYCSKLTFESTLYLHQNELSNLCISVFAHCKLVTCQSLIKSKGTVKVGWPFISALVLFSQFMFLSWDKPPFRMSWSLFHKIISFKVYRKLVDMYSLSKQTTKIGMDPLSFLPFFFFFFVLFI